MSKLIKIKEIPIIPKKWDYGKSVEKVKQVIFKWKTLTVDLANELWVARKKLTIRERDATGTFVPMDKSWSDYCKEIGSSKRVVNRWLTQWFPKEEVLRETPILPTRPKIYYCDYKDFLDRIEDNSQDLLITDPPYSTDIENIEKFANDWVIKALDKVKPTRRAFICIGAYPRELKAYLDILLSQDKFILDNPLIWTYRNTLGQTPKMKYNLNYQVVLHLYSEQSRKLDTKITNEMFSVQDINAPDGRQGDRYHTWQKPSELARRFITHTTKEGDKIFDCFSGTGTFVLMGAQLGRKVMGCDNSRDMLKIAEERGCEII